MVHCTIILRNYHLMSLHWLNNEKTSQIREFLIGLSSIFLVPDAVTFYSNYHHLALCVSGDVGYDGCVSSCIVHCVMCMYDTSVHKATTSEICYLRSPLCWVFLKIFLKSIYKPLRMRSSLVVKASDCQCTSCNGSGFDPSIRRYSGIWGAADEAVLNIVRKKEKKSPQKYF